MSQLKRTLSEKLKVQTIFFNLLSPNLFQPPFFKPRKMSSPISPTLDKVVEKIMEGVLLERVEQAANQEMVPAEEVRE